MRAHLHIGAAYKSTSYYTTARISIHIQKIFLILSLAHDLNSPDPRDDKVSEHFRDNVDGNSLLQLPSIGSLLPFACALGGHCGR